MKILSYSAVVACAATGILLGRMTAGSGDQGRSESGISSEGLGSGRLGSALGEGHGLPLSGSDLEIVLEVRRRVEADGVESYPEMWEALAKLPPWRAGRLREIVIGWWATDDPQAALMADGIDDGDLRKLLFEAWVLHDLDAAMTAASGGRDSMIKAVAKQDLAAGIAAARKYEIVLPSEVVLQWAIASPWEAIREVTKSEPLIGSEDLSHIAELREGDDLLTDLKRVGGLYTEGGHSLALMQRMLSTGEGRCSQEVVEWIIDDEILPNQNRLIAYAIEKWGEDEPERLKAWLGGIEPDHPSAADIAEAGIETLGFGADDADELFRLLDFLPEKERESLTSILAEYGGGSTAERLARIEMLRPEIDDEKYLTSLRNAYEDVSYDGGDEYQSSLLEMSARFPELDCSHLFQQYADMHPEEALPWLTGDGVPSLVREDNLRSAMREWAEVDRIAMLDFVDRELTSTSDRVAARRVIDQAELPMPVQQALEEQFEWLADGDE